MTMFAQLPNLIPVFSGVNDKPDTKTLVLLGNGWLINSTDESCY